MGQLDDDDGDDHLLRGNDHDHGEGEFQDVDDGYNHLLLGERLEKVKSEGGVAIVRRTLGREG